MEAADERAETLARLNGLIREENVLSGGRTAGGLRPDEWAARLEVPPWVSLIFGVFMFGGAAFLLLGLFTGPTEGWIAGLAFLLIGLCCSGFAWRMREHMESVLTDAAADAEHRVRASEGDLVRTRGEIRTLLTTAELDPAQFRTRKGGPRPGRVEHHRRRGRSAGPGTAAESPRIRRPHRGRARQTPPRPLRPAGPQSAGPAATSPPAGRCGTKPARPSACRRG